MKNRKNRLGKLMKFAAGAVLVVGLASQILMLSAISDKAKAIDEVQKSIRGLEADRDNYVVRMANYKKRSTIEERARELGMKEPEADQIRVVFVPTEYQNTSAHTAELSEAE